MGELQDPARTQPPVGGLGSAVGFGVEYPGLETLPRPDGPNPDWEGPSGWGMQVWPCAPVERHGGACLPAWDWDPQSPEKVRGRPVGYSVQVTCSLLTQNPEQLQAEAQDAFTRLLWSEVQRELWRGDRARAAGYSENRYLARSDYDVGGPLEITDVGGGAILDLVEAVAQLEEYLACCAPGVRKLIHVPVNALPYLGYKSQITRETSGRLATWTGNTVVAGCGYDGTGPTDFPADPSPVVPPAAGEPAVVTIYGTGPVAVRAATRRSLDDILSVDALNNDRRAEVQGLFTAGWGCCHAYVQARLC